jgi:hypothetical protein
VSLRISHQFPPFLSPNGVYACSRIANFHIV